MRTAGDRAITPLMILAMAFLLTGLHGTARSSSQSGKEDAGGKATQTQPAQTRPAQTRPTQTQPAQTRPAEGAVEPAGKEAGEKPLSFTNEDLKKYHSGPTGASTRPASATPAAEDPLKPFKDREERARWRQEKAVKMQQRILELEGKLKTLEQKRLSILNPLMPRVTEGEQEKTEETGLTGPELLARTDGEIKQTTQDLEAARKELATFLETTPE
jgi:hypothetical protein